MKAVVTGATGFVGKQIVETLLKREIEVVVLIRDRNKIPDSWKNKVKVILCDLSQLKTIDLAYLGQIDIFFHMAWTGTSGMERGNVELQLKNIQYTCDAVNLAIRINCKRFLNAGSIMEYEVMKLIPKNESIPGLGTVYSTAKLTADFMAKAVANNVGMIYLNIIISNVYGVGEKSARFFNVTAKKMLLNEEIPLTHGNQPYDFIYITDAAEAIVEVGIHGERNQNYYIGNEEPRPLKEFILLMKDTIKSQSKLEFGKIELLGETLSYKEFNTDSVSKKLGIVPKVSFAAGTYKYIEWLKGIENE